MACNPYGENAVIAIDCCTLSIDDSVLNTTLRTLNLLATDIIVNKSTVTLSDGVTQIVLPLSVLEAMIPLADIEQAIKDCRCAMTGASDEPLRDGSTQIGCTIGDPTDRFIVEVIFDEETQTYIYRKTDGTVIVEGVDFEICEETASGSEIRHKCWVDDVNGDETNLVPYIEAFCIEKTVDNKVQKTSLGYYEDECFDNEYTPTTQTNPDEVGLPATGKSGRLIITQLNTWSPVGVKSYTLRVRGSSNGSTYTDSYGVLTVLDDNEVVTWSWEQLSTDGLPVVQPMNGAEIVITYTR